MSIFLVILTLFVDGRYEHTRPRRRGFKQTSMNLFRKSISLSIFGRRGIGCQSLVLSDTNIGKEGKLKHNVLAVRELQGDHSGENQAAVVADVLVDYEIEYNLGFFVGDNAQSNDTLCKELSRCKLTCFVSP
jgi:hypothetical protein